MLQLVSAAIAPLCRWDVIAISSLVLPFLLTYPYTLWRAFNRTHSKDLGAKEPPTLPYVIPYLGHALSFAADGHQVVVDGVKWFGLGNPFRIRLAFQSLYVVSGADMVSALFKTTREANANFSTAVALEYAFGTPKEVISFYDADKSGSHSVPLLGSNTKPEDRIFYSTHKLATTFLSGQTLVGMTTRFQDNFAKAISEDTRFNDEWVELPDLYAFLRAQIFEAAVRSIFGTYVLSLNPTFVEDFWTWNQYVGDLFMRVPRWIKPNAYRTRDKLLQQLKKWHEYALEHYDILKAEEDDVEWEPYFGCKFESVRQATFMKFKALDATARAAEDFGVIWASNANVIPAATWLVIETLRNPELESQVRSEIQSLQSTSATKQPSSLSVPIFDIPTLCSSPLLQSMYAETLRLNVRVVVTRVPVLPSINLNGWVFGKDQLIGCSSAIEAMDESVWSTGIGKKHPLGKFWAERFIVYPGVEGSGPLKNQRKAKPFGGLEHKEATSELKPYFSLEGLSSTWIPYGGGVRLCPGRHFAKQEMITTMALLLSAYDIELLSPRDGKSIKEGAKLGDFEYGLDITSYGVGTCPPANKVPCRIRRRR